jgi:hypothetical protein
MHGNCVKCLAGSKYEVGGGGAYRQHCDIVSLFSSAKNVT